MKRFPALFCSCLFLLFSAGTINALEISVDFQIGNIGFADNRTSDAANYPVLYPWGISLSGNQPVSESMGIQAGFNMDPILNNIGYTILTFTQANFSLGVGPFFGLFNSPGSIIAPGLSTLFRLDFPGLLFVELRSDSSIGARLVREGDYLQERSGITFGVYVLNAIVTANLLAKSYTHITAENEVIDSLVEYSFKTDIYQKNVPYKVLLSFAYQTRTKSYTGFITRNTILHQINSIVLGTRIDIKVTKYLSFVADLESSVYSFGSAADSILVFPSSGISAYLFNVTGGITLHID